MLPKAEKSTGAVTSEGLLTHIEERERKLRIQSTIYKYSPPSITDELVEDQILLSFIIHDLPSQWTEASGL